MVPIGFIIKSWTLVVVLSMLVPGLDCWWIGGGGSSGRASSSYRDKDINGLRVYFFLEESVKDSQVESKCQDELGATFIEYRPATNADVGEVIDALDSFGEDGIVWIHSLHNSKIKNTVDAFSWSSEAVDTDLWFTIKIPFSKTRRTEPNDDEPCTALRLRHSLVKSSTGKHMLGNVNCGTNAHYLCVESPPTTTESTLPPPTTTESTLPPPTTTESTLPPPTTTESTPPPPPPPTTSSPQPTTTTESSPPLTTKQLKTRALTTTFTETTFSQSTSQNAYSQHIFTGSTSTHSQTSTAYEITTPTYYDSFFPTETKINRQLERESIPVLVCPCRCPNVTNSILPSINNISETKFIQRKTIELQHNLTLTRNDLSMTSRKKTSANDSQPSSQIGGIFACVIIVLVFGSVAMSDFVWFVRSLCVP